MQQVFVRKIFSHKLFIIGILVILIGIGTALFYFQYRVFSDSIDTTGVSSYSSIKQTKDIVSLSLHKDSGYLYKNKKPGLEGVREFLEKDPSFTAKGSENAFQDTKKRALGNNQKHTLLPDHFSQNSILLKTVKDSDDLFLKKNNTPLTNEHYVFGQLIHGIPVFAAELVIHVRNQDEIYDITGTLLASSSVEPSRIGESEAMRIALQKARTDAQHEIGFRAEKIKKYILNKKLLGISDDEKNYTVYSVLVVIPQVFSTEYFIDSSSGRIVYVLQHIQTVKNRQIYNCRNNPTCPDVLERGEGASPVSDQDVNTAYDRFGEVYDYYYNNFQRDSFDNRGAALNGYVNFPGAGSVVCPNAFWDGTEMVFCRGLVARDVTAHELTHAVVQYTVGLTGGYQSLALNESIADIFGSASDGNWTIGEGSAIGTIRDMSNPPSHSTPLGPQPDRVFSPYYYCGSADSGGGHQNNGVLNKSFYLMVEGGNFNGCRVQGIGREKAHAVIYRVLSAVYLSPAANFRSMYAAVLKACADLYSANSDTCLQVKRAVQSTEMDQQTEGAQKSPICSGLPAKIPECAGGSVSGPPSPTLSVPTPPITTVTPSPNIPPPVASPSPAPGGPRGNASITTDKSEYVLNEPIRICYSVPGSGPIIIYDKLPNGTVQVFLQGVDDGTGDCVLATITPPTGRECLSLDYTSGNLHGTVETCFTVHPVGQTPGAPVPPQNNVTPDKTEKVNTEISPIFIGNNPSPSPTPLSGGSMPKKPIEFECHESKAVTDENGRQIQISSLECKPIQ